MNSEPPRPYYDFEAVRRKRESERAALLEHVKQALGFGKAAIVPPRRDASCSSASKVIIDQ